MSHHYRDVLNCVQCSVMEDLFLGRGSSGYVVRDGKFAWKIIPLDIKNKGPVPICDDDEGKIGKKLNNKGIVKCVAHGRESKIVLSPSTLKCLDDHKIPRPEHFYFVKTGFCNGGDLQHWMTSIDNPLRTSGMAEILFTQLLEAVRYLGSKGVIHGDLKPQNIYLHFSKGEIQIRVGDLGEAFYETKPNGKEGRGTKLYQEKNFRGKKSKGYDVYSLGLIYYFLFMSGLFELDQDLVRTKEDREDALHHLLRSVKIKGYSELMGKTHPKRAKVLSEMLAESDDGANRPSVDGVQNFFADIIIKNKKNFVRSCPVPGKNPLFQGRGEVFAQVETILASATSDDITFILIEGAPGTGKMSMAAEIIHRKSESKDFNHFVCFKAESPTKLKAHYSKFKREKNLKRIRNICFSSKNNSVTDWFNTQPGWIAVYENVTDFKEVEHFIPSDPSPLKNKNTTGRRLVICTSRAGATEWPEYFTKIRIDKLGMDDCIRLIDQSLNLTGPKNFSAKTSEELGKEKEQLVKLVDFFPAAICQCMVHILGPSNKAVTDVGTYLDFHTKSMRRLNEGASELFKFSKIDKSPIYTTNLLTIDQIKSRHLPTFHWLMICAYLDPDDISELFLDEFVRDKGGLETKINILALLKGFAMLEEIVQENGSHSFRISRLVQETLRFFYNSDFSNTLERIDDVFKAMNRKFSNKKLKENGRIIFVQKLPFHLEILVNHINESAELKKELSTDESQALQPPVVLKLKARFLKGVIRGNTSLMYNTKRMNAERELEKVKAQLFGDRSLQRGTTLMSRGNTELNAASLEPKQKRESKILEAIKTLEEAAEILRFFWQPGVAGRKHHEVYQCYLYLGSCYMNLPRINDQHLSTKNPTCSQPRFKTPDQINQAFSKALEYYKKSIEILVQAVRLNYRLLKIIGSTLRRMSNTCIIGNPFVTMEKYLLLGLEFMILHEIDCKGVSKEGRSPQMTSKINDKIKFLENIDEYEVRDKSLEMILAGEREFSTEKAGVLKALLKSYESRSKLCKTRRRAGKAEEPGLLETLKSKMDYIKQVRIDCRSNDNGFFYYDHLELVQSKIAKELKPVEKPPTSIQDDNFQSIIQDDNLSVDFIAHKKIYEAGRLKKDGDNNEAKKLLDEALEIYLKCRHKDHVDTGYLYEKIGDCEADEGRYEEACENYQKSYGIVKNDLELRSRVRVDKNITFAQFIQKYVKFLPQGTEVLKIELLQEALDIFKTHYEHFGKNRRAKDTLPEKTLDPGKTGTKCEEDLKDSIGILCEKIGRLQIDIGHFAFAQTNLKEAWDIFETKLRPGHQNRISCLNMLQLCYQKLPNQEELKKCQNSLELELGKKAEMLNGIGEDKIYVCPRIERQRAKRLARKQARQEKRRRTLNISTEGQV